VSVVAAERGLRITRASGSWVVGPGRHFPAFVPVTGSSLPTTRTTPWRSADGVDDRLAVARALREIGQLLEVEGGDPHRARAYRRGAQAVESIAGDLRQLARAGRLTSVPGIGARLADTIRELLETGTCRILERLREQYPPGVLELRSVLSVARMRALHDALGITTLAELGDACASGAVRRVAGFGERTERRILHTIDAPEGQGAAALPRDGEKQGPRIHGSLGQSPVIHGAKLEAEVPRRIAPVTRLD